MISRRAGVSALVLAALFARFPDPVDHDLQRLDTRILLVDGFQDVPRRELGRCLLDHLIDRGLVLVPLLAVAPVLIGDLPLLLRICLALLEALELRLLVDLDPELDDDCAPVGELLLELIDLVICSLPVVL